MGLLKKIFRPVQKVVQKIVPKEVRPFLPYAAAAFGPAGLAGSQYFSALNPAMQKALLAGVTAAATDKDANILRTAALAAAPDLLSQGLGSIAQTGQAQALQFGDPGFFTQQAQQLAAKGAAALSPETLSGTAKLIGAQTAIESASRLAEIQEKELRDYEAALREQGIQDATQRRSAIYGYFTNAGYTPEYVNSVLDKYGYASGGRVGFKKGGIKSLVNDDEEDVKIGDLLSAMKGIEMIYGPMETKPVPMMRFNEGGLSSIDVDELPMSKEGYPKYYNPEGEEISFEEFQESMKKENRIKKAQGGLMNLGGREMDMRGGGFIPIGSKEKADDVPARLSKNEFVFTADAVRGAGGGSVNAGAKRMYDLMNKFEAMA